MNGKVKMVNDSLYDESEPSTAQDPAAVGDEHSDETEDQLALVPSHFFKKQPKPGMRETVEVVQVYENECSIKCVYSEDEDEGGDEEEYAEAEAEPEDEMMG